MKGVKLIVGVVLSIVAVAVVVFLLRDSVIAVMQPAGHIAQQQYNLIIFATLLMLVIILPVFGLTAFIVWRYRESNTRSAASYKPDWDHSRLAEGIWWGFPLLIILILSVVIWKSSHDLDPYKPLVADTKPLTVQVVALQWKWLFIYPEQDIASVNYLQIPVDTPVNFKITADAPMNSFWIPQLGGQVYAMAGMETKLHLNATKVGDYTGSSANISGEGFAGMNFTAHASTREEFDHWVQSIAVAEKPLDTVAYNALAAPDIRERPTYYSVVRPDLFNAVIMRYMDPAHQGTALKPPSGEEAEHGHEY